MSIGSYSTNWKWLSVIQVSNTVTTALATRITVAMTIADGGLKWYRDPKVLDLTRTKKSAAQTQTDNTCRKQTEERTQVTCCLYPPICSSSSFPLLLHLLFHIFFLTSCAFEYGQRPWLLRFLRERESASIWCLGINAGVFPFFFIPCVLWEKKNHPKAAEGIESGRRKLPRRKVFSFLSFF